MLSKKILDKVSTDNLFFVTLTEYDKTFTASVAFTPISIETTLAKEVSLAGLTQAHVAETEKFPHATYFLNGGQEKPHDKEKHILVPSRKDVKTHDQAPKMMAKEIADKAIEEITAGIDFLFVNFANADMVGHTANVEAILEAIEEADKQLERVVLEIERRGGVAVITADHGNAELNIDQITGEKHTAHTMSPVPFIVTKSTADVDNGNLSDVAPTVLFLLGLDIPSEMTGNNLIHD
jgi:2,3-bisphosphoglycerate-independent phosphoglycerate mutase